METVICYLSRLGMMLLSPCFFWMRMQGPSFNSIKVRLNLKYAIILVLGALFQFHKGTIKPISMTLRLSL